MRLHPKVKEKFPFNKNDVVLAKYDNEVFYAKIVLINYKREYAKCLFDDDSREDIPFQNIFDVNETTSDIICIVCKSDVTEQNNDIVLCDNCNVGFHQKCHDPAIPSDVLTPEAPWKCVYCSEESKNPYVESNPFNENAEETEEEENIKEEKEGFQKDVKQEEEIESKNEEEEDEEEKVEDNVENLITQTQTETELVTTTEECKQFSDENVVDPTQLQLTPPSYGEQVVIAHADSTSNDDLIVDIINENENEQQVVIQSEKVEKIEKVEKDLPRPVEAIKTVQQKKERYLKEFPNHNWLLERLKTEKKLQPKEIEKIEQTVYQKQKQEVLQQANLMKKFLLEKKSKSLKLDLNNNDVMNTLVEVATTTNAVHSTTTTSIRTPITPRTEVTVFTTNHQKSPSDLPKRPVVELNIPKINKEFFKNNVKSTSPNVFGKQQTKVEFPSSNNHVKIKRKISDTCHSRPVPQIYSPALSPFDSCYRRSRSPTSPLEETKTRIYRPEDIERCLMNVSPVEHTKFVYHQPAVYRETRETTIYPIAEDVFTEVEDIRRVHHRPYNQYYRDSLHDSLNKTRLLSEPSKESSQRSRLQSHPFFQSKNTNKTPAKHIEKSPAKHALKRPLNQTKYDIQSIRHLPRPSSRSDIIHDAAPPSCKRRSPGSVSSPSTVFHHSPTVHSPNPETYKRTSSFPGGGQEVYYRKEEYFVCSPPMTLQTKQQQANESKNSQPKEASVLKNYNCLNCGKSAQLLCSACRMVRYCSRKCQLEDWKDHLYQCRIEK